jgi:hypothetical protein
MVELVPAEDLLSLPDTSKRGKFEAPFENYAWTAMVTRVVNEADLFDATVHVTGPNGSYAIGTRMYRPVSPVRLP